MKSVIFLAALAAAAPLNHKNNKRDLVYSTTTQEVIETLWTTTTQWVDPTDAPSAPAGFYEAHPTQASEHPYAAPSFSAPAQAPSSAAAPAPSASAPSAPVPSAPAPSSAAPAPTSQPAAVAAPVPATSEAPAQQAAPSPTPTASSSSSSSGTGKYTGDGTYYDVEVGRGSCGFQNSNSESVVAVAVGLMNNPPNPNSNPWCGKMINIHYQGNTQTAKIVDTCPTCAGGGLDMTPTLFKALAPNGDGRIFGVTWDFA